MGTHLHAFWNDLWPTSPAPVPRLFGRCRPANVARLVIPVVVDPVERTAGRSRAEQPLDVRHEQRQVMPAVADLDAPPPPSRKVRVFRVLAARHHISPCVVERVAAILASEAMRDTAEAGNAHGVPLLAAAGLDVPADEPVRPGVVLDAAVAADKCTPEHLLTAPKADQRINDHAAPESLARLDRCYLSRHVKNIRPKLPRVAA
jgi:hypothetical protein